MKNLLIIALLFICSFGYSQNNVKDIKIRNSLKLQDSIVHGITTGDTLATKEWVQSNTLIQPADSIKFNEGITAQTNYTLYADTTNNTLSFLTGLGSRAQIARESLVKVYNATSDTIDDGKIITAVGIFNTNLSVEKAIATNRYTALLWATTDIPPSEYGDAVVMYGTINDVPTSSLSLGQGWLSAVDSGDVVNTAPSFPDYAYSLGAITKIGVSDGKFEANLSGVSQYNTLFNFWNGTIRENFDFRVTATGGVITGTLSPTDGHPDLTLMFSSGLFTFDTSPSATITLTAGINSNPQMNYVYIPESTKALTVSTSGFPTTEHKAIAKLLLKSADFVEQYKATINQNINDPLANTTTFQGQYSVVAKRIRLDHAKHVSGTEGVSTIETGPTPDDVWVSVTEGIVAQLNEHTFPAFDTQTGDSLYVSNHFVNPDTLIGNLNELLNDALGNTLNNRSFSFVAWGVINKTGEPSLVKINLPSNSYAFASPDDAVSDALNYSVYSFPTVYTGVGFLIARFTYTYKNDLWVLIDTEDLTGFTPNTAAGGGAGGTGVKSFLALDDTESSYTPYEFQIANAAGTALESPVGLNYYGDSLVADGNIHADTAKFSGYVGIGTNTPLSALHISDNVGTVDIMFSLSNILVDHGVTSIVPTNVVGGFGSADSDQGGFRIIGVTERNDNGLVLKGISQNGSALLGTVSIDGSKTSGTSTTALDANDILLGIQSGGVNKAFFMGDGSLYFGSTIGNGFSLSGTDALSGWAGTKEIFRLVEDVTEQFIINPQGDLTGTLAAPNLAFTNSDLTRDVGLFLISDNNLAITVNSIEAMRLTEDTVFVDSTLIVGGNIHADTAKVNVIIANDRIGIGTTSPTENLHIKTITGTSTDIGLDEDGIGWRFRNDQTNNRLAISSVTGSFDTFSEKFTILSSGDVGINDDTPTFKLDVNGTGRFTGIVNFDVFPITPSSAPTTDYQVANRKYVDDSFLGVMQVVKANILFSNTSQTTIITLPDDAVIWNIGVNVTTLFDAGSGNELKVGISASDDRYMNWAGLGSVIFQDVKNGGFGDGVTFIPDEMASSTNITFTYVPGGTAPNQGVANIYIHYTTH